MAVGEIIQETEVPGGWAYDAQLVRDDGSLLRLTVTMSWPDYNHLCPDGTREPQDIALDALHDGVRVIGIEGIGARLDVSTVRRAMARREHRDNNH